MSSQRPLSVNYGIRQNRRLAAEAIMVYVPGLRALPEIFHYRLRNYTLQHIMPSHYYSSEGYPDDEDYDHNACETQEVKKTSPTNDSDISPIQAFLLSELKTFSMKWLDGYPGLKDTVSKATLFYSIARYGPAEVAKVWRFMVSHILASARISKSESPDLHANITDFIRRNGMASKRLQRHVKAQGYFDASRPSGAAYPKGLNGITNSDEDLSSVFFEGESSSWQFFRYEGRSFFYTREDNGDIQLWRWEWSPKTIQSLIGRINEDAHKARAFSEVMLCSPMSRGNASNSFWSSSGTAVVVHGTPLCSLAISKKELQTTSRGFGKERLTTTIVAFPTGEAIYFLDHQVVVRPH